MASLVSAMRAGPELRRQFSWAGSVMTDALEHHEAQEAGSAAPRGLDARRRLVGPRPHGALTLCVPLRFVLRV